ncbi:aspartyl-phosphate phosphatase Spo0E family protein [Caryophanon latum]|uniref:aspartyl-phosphate phosphatase Spo0E family protein n=1 Tax=Caryophanon latum TaxID=33977 RepID=UPI0009FC2B2E|nr:aspartyl-phosphate phosphatase Spo0E family protein [Caryophanon latum]
MENLLTRIEAMRAKMIEAGIVYGFRHEKTIQLSRQVDELLNAYDSERRTMITNRNNVNNL